MSDDGVIEITDIDDNLTISLDDAAPASSTTPRSFNFGPGVELLMNDKTKKDSGAPKGDIDLGDLDKLETELDELSSDVNSNKKSVKEARSSLFSIPGLSGGSSSDNTKIDDDNSDKAPPSIGKATAKIDDTSEKTWDGFTKFNDIPLAPDTPATPELTKEETLREKFKYLRKLEDLEKKGATLTKKYTMDSALNEMQGEYEMIISEKEKSNSVKFQGRMLMACITGLEFLNNRFDPFDIKLDGWSEQINENIDDYDEIFAELHEKYRSKAKMAPELKLLFQLGGSAAMLHMTNTMFKSAMPGMDDIMRQNPDLMQQFQSAAVNSMSANNPGFGNFMGGMVNPEPSVGAGGPPPPPMKTKNMAPPQRPGNGMNALRPDIRAARDDGIDVTDNFENPNKAERSKRPDMKGPSDISDLLSGLKTKSGGGDSLATPKPTVIEDNGSSTISISELKEMQNGGSAPARSKRRGKSDKNTISLAI